MNESSGEKSQEILLKEIPDSTQNNLATQDITSLLSDWSTGEDHAFDRLFPAVYENLRRTARYQLQKQSHGHTLQPTAIINEVYIQLSQKEKMHFNNRMEFFRFSTRIIRNILVDYARAQQTQKRGGDNQTIKLEDCSGLPLKKSLNFSTLLSLNEALDELSTWDKRQAHIVELRFFGGFRIGELAEVYQISEVTVHRELKTAKCWLAGRLGRFRSNPGAS